MKYVGYLCCAGLQITGENFACLAYLFWGIDVLDIETNPVLKDVNFQVMQLFIIQNIKEEVF